jgi:arylsulfatase A-like enzyme
METAPKAVIPSNPSWLLLVAPNPAILLFGLGGWLCETVLLSGTSDNIYHMSGVMPVLSALLLGWYWLTVGWVVWGIVCAARNVFRVKSTWVSIRLAMLLLVAIAGAVAYAVSWGFYLRAGRFLGIQLTIRVIQDGPQLWQFLVDAEPKDVKTFGFAAAGLLCGVIPLVVWLFRSNDVMKGSLGFRRSRRWIWMSFTLLVAVVFRFVVADPSDLRRVPRISSLTLRLNPAFTLVGTTLDRFVEDRIEPCLDEEKLTPIVRTRGASWSSQAEPLSVIFVVIEAMRHDVVFLKHQNRDVTPNLNALARRGVQFTHAYSQSTHTDYAEPCIVSSLYPIRTRRHCYYQTSDPWPKTLIYDLLQPAGYATALISSENLGWGSMDGFFQSPGLDFIYEAQRSGQPTYVPDKDGGFVFETRTGPLRAGKLDDAVTTDRAIEWIQHQTEHQHPFFLYLDFQSSHFPYPAGRGARQPYHPCELNSSVTFLDYPIDETETVRNAYYNALAEADRQLGRLVKALQVQGVLHRTILVVTGDHGESFHEQGLVTHAREPIESVIRVPLVIYAPACVSARADDYLVQHVDIVPTVLSLMGQSSHPSFQGTNVLAVDRPPNSERLAYIHTENGLARVEAVVSGNRWKLINNRRTNSRSLYDLASDPDESSDVYVKNPEVAASLGRLLETWRRQQLAYYNYPMYYLRFYPPAAPQIADLQ